MVKSVAKLAFFTLALVLLQGCSTQGGQVPTSEFEDFRPQLGRTGEGSMKKVSDATSESVTDMGEMKIRWVLSDDVATVCHASTLKRVIPTMAQMSSPAWLATTSTPKQYLACAIWDDTSKTCLVVTGKKTNHVIMGHEFRHCYEKHFH